MSTFKGSLGAPLATSALAVSALFASASLASANEGSIVFYEGNGGSQDIVQTINDSPGQNFRPDKNDEARSVVLHNVREGAVIRVFDHPESSTKKPHAVIEVKKSSPESVVRTFERTYEDENVRVTFTPSGGDELDGKVSRIRVE